ncbi:MAG: hypothetical protein J7M01_03585 [Candidatus Marinimicrobia bacterium]|nr:hypothetical protein [Candidatus Neomarinimicrobiota bacterium]
MKRNFTVIIIVLLAILLFSCSVKPGNITYEMSHAPFPHPERNEGHTYKSDFYSFEEHYSDSSVLVMIPRNYKKRDSVDLMIFFHGWGNSKDTCNQQFNLGKQLEASKKNMLLVIPEGPKFAPDSFDGKLCDEGGFTRFIDELLDSLKADKIIRTKKIGRIILSGHSGGYYVMAHILRWGGYTEKISDVIIFDGLYWLENDYLQWLIDYNGRLVNIYTEHGGTKDNTLAFMEMCDSLKIDYYIGETKDLKEMPTDRILMLYSDLGHSDVMHKRENLLKILKSMK